MRALVSMPRCWQWLIAVRFEPHATLADIGVSAPDTPGTWTDQQGRTIEVQIGAAPVECAEPRQFDFREIAVRLHDQEARVCLCSGQIGYWGEVQIGEGEPLIVREHWDEVIDLGGHTFIIIWRD